MVKPAQKRRGRLYLIERTLSDRRACRAVCLPRSTAAYRPRKQSDEIRLVQLIHKLSAENPRSGYRAVLDRLRERGMRINHKRLERLWHEQRLARPRKIKGRQQRKRDDQIALPNATRANERWALDFLADSLTNGKQYRLLAVLDVVTRECVGLSASRSMPASRVVATLDRIALVRGVPEMITVDNGPELISRRVRAWAERNQVTLRYSRPATPTDNPFIESFNARLRDECSELWFIDSIDEAQSVLDQWRRHYNEKRGHGSLGRKTPTAFAAVAPWIDYRPPVDILSAIINPPAAP